MSIDEIKTEALKLSPASRAILARDLLASLETLSAAEIERLWIDEAVRRDEEIDRGAAQLQPADDVFARAQARQR
jgi:hypothetical protein